MTDYTPTTDGARLHYATYGCECCEDFHPESAAEFDRWLAAHDKEVLDAAAQRVAILHYLADGLGNPEHACSSAEEHDTLNRAEAAIRGEGA
jgi:hypothetical protein